MKTVKHTRHASGFVLLEALVALVIVALGLLSIARLQAITLASGGDTKAKAQAIAMVENQLDTMRNQILKGNFTAAMSSATSTSTPAGSAFEYTMTTTVSSVSGTADTYLVQVAVSWSDLLSDRLSGTSTATQSVAGRTVVGWDDPALGRSLTTGGVGGGLPLGSGLKTPVGAALKGDGAVQTCGTGECITNNDGSKIKTKADGTKELLDSTGKRVLTLPVDAQGNPRNFTTVAGKVYIDREVSGFSMNMSDVSVRLSSEGHCFMYGESEVCTGGTCSDNNKLYDYKQYVCYVGEGWYGNVGIWNAGNQTPKVCVGDPTFNNGASNGTLVSPHPAESNIRSYRGFKQVSSVYYTTGVPSGRNYPTDGAPKPSSLAYSGVTAGSSSDHFTHHFLLTKANQSCVTRMNLSSTQPQFVRNAGKYYCISPDDDSAADVCPANWPGFPGAGSGGGGATYLLSTSVGSGGTVSSNPAGISCGASGSGACDYSFTASTPVTLSASASLGYEFSGWSGAGVSCAGTGSCQITMDSDKAVTASFTSTGSSTYQLAVSLSGTGTVTSSPSGVNCPSVCAYSYAQSTSVTLTAVPGAGNAFAYWSGAGCSGSGTCTVTMDSAKSVTATFVSSSETTKTLTLTKSGSGVGTVSSSPSGISCGTSCLSANGSFAIGSSVTLTASAGSGNAFGGWTGACSGTSSTCVVSMTENKSVTATFYPATCTTNVSGSAKITNGKFTIAPAATGSSCANDSGNNLNYSCTLTHAGGTAVTLRNTSANGDVIHSTLNITTNCTSNTNVNFP